MFEPDETEKTTAQRRSRAILLIGAIGALVLALLMILAREALQTDSPRGAILENAVRAGAADFDSYRERLALEEKEIIVHPNMIGMAQYEVRAKLTNRGDRTISGLEMVGRIINLQDQAVKEAISLPIPRLRQQPLGPGESMRISVKVDAPARVSEADVKDVTIELRGLRFQ